MFQELMEAFSGFELRGKNPHPFLLLRILIDVQQLSAG